MLSSPTYDPKVLSGIVLSAVPSKAISFIFLAVCNLVAVEALPFNEPLKVGAVTVPGKDVLPEPSNNVAVLVNVPNLPLPYCLTYIGSLASSAVAISKYAALLAVAPPTILQ